MDSSNLVPITQDMIDRLVALKNKVSLSYAELYQYGKKHTHNKVFIETPDSLPQKWVSGRVKATDIDYYNAIIETLESIPEFHRGRFFSINETIAISDDFRERLQAFVDKPRQLSMKKILQYTDAPKELTPATISQIISGRNSGTTKEYYEYLERLISDSNS